MRFFTIKTAGVQDIVALCGNGEILYLDTMLRVWKKTGIVTKERLEKEGIPHTLYALREYGFNPPVRPIAPLEWTWDEAAEGYYAPAFVEGYRADLIIVEGGGVYNLYYNGVEKEDFITSHESIMVLRDKAQALHEQSLMAEFFS